MSGNKIVILAVGMVLIAGVALLGISLVVGDFARMADEGFGFEQLQSTQADASTDATTPAVQTHTLTLEPARTVHVLLATDYLPPPDAEQLRPLVKVEGSLPAALEQDRLNLTINTSVAAIGLFSLKSEVTQAVTLVWENPQEGYYLARMDPFMGDVFETLTTILITAVIVVVLVVVLVVLLLRKPKTQTPPTLGGRRGFGEQATRTRFNR
ncbi:MAG: hypothetical protein ACFBZ8_13225 [Opitutales bacterium]